MASKGVSDVVYTLINNIETRPDCNVIISKCAASDFLENSSPIFESNPANYYELILNSTEYSGYVADLTLSNFYANIVSTTSEACAILGSINTEETHGSDNDKNSSLDGNYKASQTPIESKNKNSIENMGTAVFSGDKLVGELDNIETLCYLIVTNKLENATITIPNPFNLNSTVALYVRLNKDTQNKVSFVNGYPFIECDVSIAGDILSLDGSIDLTNSNNVDMLNSYVNKYLEDIINSYLYKTSKEFKADISNFGKYVLPQYATWNEWIASDWLNNYQNAFFKVTVDTKLQGSYLFTKI